MYYVEHVYNLHKYLLLFCFVVFRTKDEVCMCQLKWDLNWNNPSYSVRTNDKCSWLGG
jgi:hypothetical protein